MHLSPSEFAFRMKRHLLPLLLLVAAAGLPAFQALAQEKKPELNTAAARHAAYPRPASNTSPRSAHSVPRLPSPDSQYAPAGPKRAPHARLRLRA